MKQHLTQLISRSLDNLVTQGKLQANLPRNYPGHR